MRLLHSKRLTWCLCVLSLPIVGCCSPCKKSHGTGASSSSSTSATLPPWRQLGPGDDTPAARWSSPADSLAAIPPWAGRRSYAPQIASDIARQWYEGGSREPWPDSEESMAVCRVSYDGTPDQGLKGIFNSSAPDLSVTVKLPGKVQLHAAGPEDSHHMMLSVPLLTKPAPAQLELELVDRDGVGWDTLDTVKVPLPPQGEARNKDSHAACVLVPRDEVETRLPSAVSLTDKALERASETVSAELSSQMLGALSLHSELEKALSPMASLVGWADPRVRRRIDWAGRIVARHRQLCAELAAHEAPSRQRSATLNHQWANWSLEVIGWECSAGVTNRYPPRHGDQDPTGCVVALGARHDGERPAGFSTFDRFVSGELVHADGEVSPMWAVASTPDEGLEPGKAGTLVFAMAAKQSPWELESTRRPLLLILRGGFGTPAVTNVDGLGRWDGKAVAR